MQPEEKSQIYFDAKNFPDFSYFIDEGKDLVSPLDLRDLLDHSNDTPPPGNDQEQPQGLEPPIYVPLQNILNMGQARYQGIPPKELIFDPGTDKSFFSFGKDALYRFVGKDSEEDGHALCLGGTGAGKTSGIALPTMATWRGPIFTFDFKGDMTAWAKAMGRDPKVLSLVDGQRNDFYLDPYDLLRKGGESHIIENAREIAGALIPLYPGNEKETFWVYATRGLLSAAIVYYFRLGLDFIETMLVTKARSTRDLIKEIQNDRLAMICLPGDLLSSDGQTAGTSTDIHNHILDFVSSPTVCDALSASSMEHKKLITWENLAHEDIFIRIDQSRVSQWSDLIRLMLVQAIKTLERRPEKFTPEGRQIEPTLLMLDEFPQYGQVRELTSAMKVLRSKKVTFALFCQSFADLDETYGAATRKTIVDNCSYLAILGAQDADTSKCLSEMIGKYKTVNCSVSYHNYMYGHAQSDSFSLTETERPVMPPEEFRTLKDVILLNPYGYGFCRVEKDTWFQKEPPETKNEERGDSYMETSIDKRLNNAENKVRYLEDQKKRAKKAEEELNKKREAQICFLIGQQLICHFPQLLENCMGGSKARENTLKRLDYMLDALSSDSAALENLKEQAQEMDLLFSESQDEICEEPDEM